MGPAQNVPCFADGIVQSSISQTAVGTHLVGLGLISGGPPMKIQVMEDQITKTIQKSECI